MDVGGVGINHQVPVWEPLLGERAGASWEPVPQRLHCGNVVPNDELFELCHKL
jgi:hypothetical protein